ncbi:Bug family tripartite tricarboxylate transporter substrate binding protein [Advenella mimigardefordensis]|uniref:Putative Bug-like extracytoplasmic solute binding receptor, TTT family n=1 Tax=Advenella mimigardefordensis (strain DSM 17166 / LMG 22922 / DPN7) TaxID=1247726 RepID=W0PGB7_ADVMD|nr:tripartite tricarboxylate transporter substrate binding protein [Advenella mimigardefordensis]AHG64163.1 putative Bug-like extracytoplasmic solute binding receptor, TTT family [Advenella mimigardefordensis DPN7]
MTYRTISKPLFLQSVIAGSLLGFTSAALANDFPERPLRIIVNTGPGGLVDLSTRLVAEKMSENLGQPVVVENRAGGDGGLGARTVKTAKPDGYTLLSSAGTVVIQPLVKLNPIYDMKDFTGVGPVLRSPVLMVTGASQPDKTLADFIARAKANPGKMSYASAGVGTTTHIGAALFLKQAGLNLLHVPYKGNGTAMPDVMSGRVDMIFEAYGSGAPKVNSGSLKALAVTSTSRLADLPNVQTFAEQGVKDFSYYLWVGMLAPAGTPEPVVKRLNEALRYALSSKEITERFRTDGSEALSMTPAEFDQFLVSEEEKNGGYGERSWY